MNAHTISTLFKYHSDTYSFWKIVMMQLVIEKIVTSISDQRANILNSLIRLSGDIIPVYLSFMNLHFIQKLYYPMQIQKILILTYINMAQTPFWHTEGWTAYVLGFCLWLGFLVLFTCFWRLRPRRKYLGLDINCAKLPGHYKELVFCWPFFNGKIISCIILIIVHIH